MKYIKLNKNWNAEPNTPELKVLEGDNGIQLSFVLNSIKYPHIDAGEFGKLQFNNVFAYKLGAISEEEYMKGQFRFNNQQLPWGEFYELLDSKWDKNFPDEKVILNEKLKKNSLRHFIFFLKNEVFECLATDYEFKFNDVVSEQLEEKYPKGYLNHYLSMFATHFDKASAENYMIYTDLYIQMEGKKEFEDLKNEIKKIKGNNDLDLYVKFINYMEIENFGNAQLNEMIKVIEAFKA